VTVRWGWGERRDPDPASGRVRWGCNGIWAVVFVFCGWGCGWVGGGVGGVVGAVGSGTFFTPILWRAWGVCAGGGMGGGSGAFSVRPVASGEDG